MNPQSPAPIMPNQYQTDDLRIVARPRRNRQSAKKAGSGFERAIADWLKDWFNDDRIDRRVKRGGKDRGDVTGVQTIRGGRVVIEAKNVRTLALPAWLREAEIERGHDDAAIGVVVHKRHGVGDPAQQYVTMTLETFARLLEGGADL